MIRYYIAEFSETVVVDGVTFPLLPWDGLAANVHCVYPRADKGRYLASHVVAAIEADEKVHAHIAAVPGVTVAPDDVMNAKLKDVPADKRSEIEQKALALQADTRDLSGETSLKLVLDRIGKQLKPTFDLAQLQPLPIEAADAVVSVR